MYKHNYVMNEAHLQELLTFSHWFYNLYRNLLTTEVLPPVRETRQLLETVHRNNT